MLVRGKVQLQVEAMANFQLVEKYAKQHNACATGMQKGMQNHISACSGNGIAPEPSSGAVEAQGMQNGMHKHIRACGGNGIAPEQKCEPSGMEQRLLAAMMTMQSKSSQEMQDLIKIMAVSQSKTDEAYSQSEITMCVKHLNRGVFPPHGRSTGPFVASAATQALREVRR